VEVSIVFTLIFQQDMEEDDVAGSRPLNVGETHLTIASYKTARHYLMRK
jgi:hypothetical protein